MVVWFLLCLDFVFAFLVWTLPPTKVKAFSEGLCQHPVVGVCFFMCLVWTMSLALEVGAHRRQKLAAIWFCLVGIVGIMLYSSGDSLHAYFAIIAMVGPTALAAILWTECGRGAPLACAVASLCGVGLSLLALPAIFWLFQLFLFLSLAWAFWVYLN